MARDASSNKANESVDIPLQRTSRATVEIHERKRSISVSGPLRSRYRHLGSQSGQSERLSSHPVFQVRGIGQSTRLADVLSYL